MESKLKKILCGASVRTWNCGGVWISAFDNPAKSLQMMFPSVMAEVIIKQMISVAHSSFGIRLNEESNDGAREHILGADKLVIAYDNKFIRGFASAKLAEAASHNIYFIHGIAVGRDYQQNGDSRHLASALISLSPVRTIAFTTQNPIAYCLLAKQLEESFPNNASPIVLPVWRNLGMRLAKWRSDGQFNQSTFVIKNLYEECLYRRIPTSKSQEVNQWFEQELSIDDGLTRDGFLIIGQKPQSRG